MIVIKDTKMFVQLASCFEIARYDQMLKNKKLTMFNKPKRTVFVEINSIKEACLLCYNFTKRFNLENSFWSGGMDMNEDFNFIANIFYNGRVWDNLDWKIAKEILC